MKIHFLQMRYSFLGTALLLAGCGSVQMVSTPIENIDTVPLKITELTEQQKKTWGHADLITDTIPGMSVDKAYVELINNQKGQTVVVAVLDSGVDFEHEDLDDNAWTNPGEKPGNGKDDDNNGFVDDVHGYNFLGTSYNEQLEYTRILRLNLGDAALQDKARQKLEGEKAETSNNKERYSQILQSVEVADAAVKAKLGKDSYTKKEVMSIETEDAELQQHIAVLLQMFNFRDTIPEVLETINEGLTYFTDKLNYHLNEDFNGREAVGDDPYDLDDTEYGNGNPLPVSDEESHGTHVAGIIAAERNNGLGVNGVATNVQIMSIRAVPNGDEYDKDIARGIRYAVDNGATIINASFGKSFSPKAEWVYDAIAYAAANDVLIVHAAGNDALNLDQAGNENFPNDSRDLKTEFTNNVITVGALNPDYGSEMVAAFSNYGKINVDIFAPGGEIYSTMPDNTYKYSGGTSMAAPAVSGIAALIRSYFPKLTANQVKKIIMQSGLTTKTQVVVGGDSDNTATFDAISSSGKMANAYNALILASQVANGQINI
jgi:subtilisin family serine protease